MTIDVNDPRLTAFVLGELEADENTLVAAAVADSPELQAEVAAIRAAAGQVTTALALEPAPSLLPAQRAAIYESAGRAATARVRGPGKAASIGSKVPQVASSKILSLYSGLRAVAAVLAVAVGVSLWRTSELRVASTPISGAAQSELDRGGVSKTPANSQPISREEIRFSIRPSGAVALSGTEFERNKLAELMDRVEATSDPRGIGQGWTINPGLSPGNRSGDWRALANRDSSWSFAVDQADGKLKLALGGQADGTGVSHATLSRRSLGENQLYGQPGFMPRGQAGLYAIDSVHARGDATGVGKFDLARVRVDRATGDALELNGLGQALSDFSGDDATISPAQARALAALGYAGQPEAMTEELWNDGESPPKRDLPRLVEHLAKLDTTREALRVVELRHAHDASPNLAADVASITSMTLEETQSLIEELNEGDSSLVTRCVELTGLSAEDAQKLIDELKARRAQREPAPPPLTDNPFLPAYDSPLSTFSIDVDTAAYTIVRRQILSQQRVEPDSVRIEELVNYFPYDYAPPTDSADPFATHIEIAACPWRPAHRLVRIGLKGREIEAATRPSTNLVFLIDVSGSMEGANRLPLVQKSLKMLVNQLAARAAEGGAADDRIALTVYAGNAGLVLPSTSVRSGHDEIIAAIDRLQAGGSTNGGSGINLAYHVARENFIAGGVNRVILATDGDWNVGVTDNTSLETLIQDQARSGVYLSVLGFGIENLNDHMLEMLADKGDGNYAYIDTENEARKALVDQLDGTLVTIAKDVKIQVEFNPALVAAYRLIGYENRVMPAEDFNDDAKDAGEIGAGHTVTALYEVVPVMETPLDADAQADADATEAAPAEVAAEDASAAAPAEVAAEDASAAPPADFVGPPAPYEARDLERTIANWELGLPDVLNNPAVDPLKYLSPQSVADALLSGNGELLTVKLRYKLPEGGPSLLHEFCAVDLGDSFESASADFRFAASVAAFGMSLRNSPYRADASTALAAELAKESVGEDQAGLRADFVQLLKQFDGKPTQ